LAVEELRAEWGIPFGSGALLADICSELVRTAEQSKAGDIAQAEAERAITASAAVLDAVADAVAQWTPDEAQAPYKDELLQQIDQARTVMAQWLKGRIPPAQASVSLGACAHAAQDTLWAITEAMIADGVSEDIIQEMVGQLVASLERLAGAASDPVALIAVLVPSPAATPGGTPPALEVLSHQSYVEGESFHIVGEVRNNSSTPMETVNVVATLYDDSGKMTGADRAFTALDVIPPGGRSPFETATDEWVGTTHYELQVEGSPGDAPRQDLVILAHEHYVDGDWLHVQGEVQNTGSVPAESVQVVITLYDAGGNVVGMSDTFTTLDVIPPAETSPFQTGTDRWPDFDHYDIQVQGQ